MERPREFNPSIQENFENSSSSFRDRFKKTMYKTVALAMMFSQHVVGYAQTHKPEGRASFAPSTAEKVETGKKSFTVAEIRVGLKTDPAERIFISTDADPENQLFELSGGGTSTGYVEYEQIDKMLSEREVSKFVVHHTHPLAAYRNVFAAAGTTKKEQRDYRTGLKKVPPHPPSMSDFQSQFSFQKKYNPRNIKVESEVIDDSGTWNYSVEEDSALMDQLAAAELEVMSAKEKLSPEQQNIINEILQSGEVDPRFISQFLQSLTKAEDPTGAKRKLGEILLKLENELAEKYAAPLKSYQAIEALASEVVLASTEAQRKIAIEKYIKLCENHGIKVTYNPKN